MPSLSFDRQNSSETRPKKSTCFKLVKLLFQALPTIAFGVFTLIVTLQQNAASQAAREQDQRQADELNRRILFKDYINDLKELLLNDTFQTKIDKVLLLIRVRTLTVLQNLDAQRKRDIILFLYENRLLNAQTTHRVNLRGADLNNVQFATSPAMSCNLEYIHLSGVSAGNITFDHCILKNAVFDYAEMSGATFQCCSMEDTSFIGANLTRARLRGNDVFESDFTDSILRQSSMERTAFGHADLRNADLYESDISSEHLFFLPIPVRDLSRMVNARLPNGSFTTIDVNTSLELEGAKYKVRTHAEV